ncbi:MAG: hypothetical protein CYPHOPRED_001787 [Cyphobasidiales sp. Tagirdzhanova-0007]|nr:MAG: hypothetical protein CYPHOPRED_001787 [Cyphobasidiales sp. Tagirdzhanova-0007]
MFSSIDYLTRKATFKQVVPSIPITQEIPDSEDPATFEESKKQLVEDFLRKAKQIEYLIDSLPAAPEHTSFTPPPISTKGDNHGGLAVHTPEKTFQDERDSVDTDPDLIELEKEMRAVNGEYQSVLEQAEKMQDQLKEVIHHMLDEHRTLSIDLLMPC